MEEDLNYSTCYLFYVSKCVELELSALVSKKRPGEDKEENGMEDYLNYATCYLFYVSNCVELELSALVSKKRPVEDEGMEDGMVNDLNYTPRSPHLNRKEEDGPQV
jgi:hypothetical protein